MVNKEAFVEIVAAINPDDYDMKWSIDVTLEVNGVLQTIDLQFTTWGDYVKGAYFYINFNGSLVLTTPTQAAVDACVAFFTGTGI